MFILLFFILQAQAASPIDKWQGEWIIPTADDREGHLTIRGCSPQTNICEVAFYFWGRNHKKEPQYGNCHNGDFKELAEKKYAPFVALKDDTARGDLKYPIDAKECRIEMTVDDKQIPISMTANLVGKDCKAWCTGEYSPLPAKLIKRSNKNYHQYSTWTQNGTCFKDDSRAAQAWCLNDDLFALTERWDALGNQIDTNLKKSTYEERGKWQGNLLKECETKSDPGNCLVEAFTAKIAEYEKELNGAFLGKFTNRDVLKTIFTGYDKATGKTGRKTNINKDGEKDELIVFNTTSEVSFLPGYVVNLCIVAPAKDSLYANGFFSILREKGEKLELVHIEEIVSPDTDSGKLLVWDTNRSGTELKFDLANFKMNGKERALGYRMRYWSGGTGGEAGEEILYLYRVTDNKAHFIFQDAMARHNTFEGTKEQYVLNVDSQTHNGNFDWIVVGKQGKKKVRTVYEWDGSGYKAKKN